MSKLDNFDCNHFHLDDAIANWKNSFHATDSMQSKDVLELETHLRDLVSELITSKNLNDQDAFLVATHRIGNPAELDGEFGKINGATVWRTRILWMLGGILAYVVGTTLINTIAITMRALAIWDGKNTGATGAIILGTMIVCWAGLFAYTCFLAKKPLAGLNRIPMSWVGGAGLVIVLSFATRSACLIYMSQLIDISKLGEISLWHVYGNRGIQVCLFIAAMLLVRTLNEPNLEIEDKETA